MKFDNKSRLKKELERLEDKKLDVKRNMEETIDTQEGLLNLMDKIYNQDFNLENDDIFMECYNKIKNKANLIQEAYIEEYRRVCEEYDVLEEEWYLLSNTEIEADVLGEQEEIKQNDSNEEESCIWIED